MLDSQKNVFFELIGTWNGDLGDSDHLWIVFRCGAFWRGPGSYGGHDKIGFACNVEAWVKTHVKKLRF